MCAAGWRHDQCVSKNPHKWLDVGRVEFSDKQGVWKETFDINYDAQTYLEKACGRGNTNCSPFLFDIPEPVLPRYPSLF
jgi:hypothetical protein